MQYVQETTSTSTQVTLQSMNGHSFEHEGTTQTHALLKNVETVYLDSMTQEDRMQELEREQKKAEQQQQRQADEIARLRQQLHAANREQGKNHEVRPTPSLRLASECARDDASTWPVLRQTKRVLQNNKVLMEGIVKMQKELKNTQQSGVSMVNDLQQSTAHHRGLFVSLSRDIHWIKQKQQDRKKLKQANCLLHEKTTELKEKLAATEKQAEGTRRGLEEKVNELKDKLSATEKQAERTLEEKTNELKVLLRPLQLPARSARSPPRDSPSPPTPLARTSLRRPRRRPRAPSEGWKSSCLPPRTTVTPPGRRPRSVTTRSSRRRATTPARDPPS